MDLTKLFTSSFIVIAVLSLTASFEGRGQKTDWEKSALIAVKKSADLKNSENGEAKILVSRTEKNYGRRINALSRRFQIDRELLIGIIAAECSGKKNSNPMQVEPVAMRQIGAEYTNSYGNLRAGAKYLKYLLSEFSSTDAAIAAYNLGETRVKKRLKRRGFKPGQVVYVKKVNSIKMAAERLS